METAQTALLPDGKRLHLHHGPIDLIVQSFGADQGIFYRRASRRFATVLEELVAELPLLRRAANGHARPSGLVARRMVAAVSPHARIFVTPMAAVAGAVADEILDAMKNEADAGAELTKAYVNNGGDTAFFLTPGQHVTAAIAGIPSGRIVIDAASASRGMASSGWRGRSHSLGIADSVSVVAKDAAAADVAATLIANQVDLPGHDAIVRQAADDLSPDSDLGHRQVTVEVGFLTKCETDRALDRGAAFASEVLSGGLMEGAVLFLNGRMRQVGHAVAKLNRGEMPCLNS